MTTENLLNSPVLDSVSSEDRDVKTAKEHSRPFLSRSLTLRTCQTQKLFEKTFDKLNSQLYAATKVLRLQNRTKEARENEALIENLFSAFSTELNATLSQMKDTLKDRMGEEVPVLSYDHTLTIEAKASSSFSLRALNLFSILDELIATAELMEISNLISPEMSDKTAKSWCYTFRKFVNQIREIRSRSFPKSNEEAVEGSEAEAETPKNDENDKSVDLPPSSLPKQEPMLQTTNKEDKTVEVLP
mgnify:CR=1 FL=1|jgi:DNA polymerase III alpha subunit (gram-positive type)